MRLKAGILGASGYAGNELVHVLLNRPKVEISYIGSSSSVRQSCTKPYSNTPLNLNSEDKSLDELELDVLFTATSHEFSAKLLSEFLLKKMKIINLSADFCSRNPKDHELQYRFTHPNQELLKNAIYGLCELYQEEIKSTGLVADPGCYATCSILSFYPLFKEKVTDLNSMIIDAKGGISGAGRSAKVENLSCKVSENIKAYELASYRHTPEIEEHLNCAAGRRITLQFTPHPVPIQRGILATAYASSKYSVSEEEIREIYRKYCRDRKFIKPLPPQSFPQIRWVKSGNFTDINFNIDERVNRIIALGATDNLTKGTAGQTVQNMNSTLDFDESEGFKSFANL